MPDRKDLANAVRMLAVDAVEQAGSGHPGMPMGMADVVEVLWNDYFQHNPINPHWANRDRLVFSNGHGSMLVYALLHLSGYDLPIAELKRFRQLHSHTPGHPEYGDTPGVETTTGPLGQGLANAVGMALAEKILAAQFNRPGFEVINHHTYVLLGDGCLMEGISHEVCSLAGTLGLRKLIAFYDDNGISIDGAVEGWFTDDTPKRFAAYGWHVVPKVDGHNVDAIKAAIEAALSSNKPSLICCQTVIGYGSPNKAGSESAHGAPLGVDEVQRVREQLQWPHPPFVIPEKIYSAWDGKAAGESLEKAWQARFNNYQAAHADLAGELLRRLKGDLPADFATQTKAHIEQCQQAGADIASRKASLNTLNALVSVLPELLGGSADLTGSNLTAWKGAKPVTAADPAGSYIYYGVREFGMSAIMNGIALYGGFIPFGGTFLVFMDYARNAVRMAALMKQRCIFVYTHDSIGLGEDGPTHQPIEQLTSLRTTPQLSTWRPCDAVESAVAWQMAIERNTGPTALIFSRQTLPHQTRSHEQVNAIRRGGYILSDSQGEPTAVVIATGSEVLLAMQAKQALGEQGAGVRVVSMPSCDTFDAQDESYRESVLPGHVTARVAVEAGHKAYWHKYVGLAGGIIGINTFGASAPASDLMRYFELTVDAVVAAIRACFVTNRLQQAHKGRNDGSAQ